MEIILSACCITLSICLFRTSKRMKEYTEIAHDCIQENKLLKEENILLKLRLRNQSIASFTPYMQSSSYSSTDKDVLDAVRYAVKKSHPDNGGNVDDFIKFNECLKKIKEVNQCQK